MKYNSISQVNFLIPEGIRFNNRFCSLEDIPPQCAFCDEAKLIASYNNHEKGIIEDDFFLWAIQANISYDAMKWFIEDFSGIKDDKISSFIKSFYKQYMIYCDESNNPVKFRFKNSIGDTNASWYDDFILAGVVVDNIKFNINELFDDFELQESIKDVKLRHIAKYKGDDPKRIWDIFKSEKIRILFSKLIETDGIYIHWMALSLWYFSLVDLVDSCIEIPFISDQIKNALYEHAINDTVFFPILSKYNYPNIKNESIKDFCSEIINWIDGINAKDSEEEFCFECLRQGIKSSRRNGQLIFLHDNVDGLLIDNFVSNYATRISAFPNSNLLFDECGIVQENIKEYVDVICTEKVPKFSFCSSTDNRFIQLSDFISGITGALMAYINTHDEHEIMVDVDNLSSIQCDNLRLFMKLRDKSTRHNLFFDNMSKNYTQINRIHLLMKTTKIHVENI